jgi:hypothetical protein
VNSRTDRYLDLARRVANQSESERNERLRNTDPALARALEEVMRIRFGLEEPKDEV